MVTTIHAIAILLALQGVAPQARPNFSGDWVLADGRPSLLGEKFTAKQDEKTLTLDISAAAIGRPIHVVYNLDGSETKNMNPSPAPGVADEPIFSRASWEGEKLVILTRGTALVKGKPTESKRVLWLSATGQLMIERSSEGAPMITSAYRRAQ
jgi:hypothetical protein